MEESKNKRAFIWPFYFCFLVFGILSALGKSEVKMLSFLLTVIISLMIGALVINLLIILLKVFNKNLIIDTGTLFAKEAVASGMMFLIPFTVLAMLAFFVLNWNVVMPFASAAITTSAANAGTEVIKKGGKSIKNLIIPSVLGMFFSTVWMLILAILP